MMYTACLLGLIVLGSTSQKSDCRNFITAGFLRFFTVFFEQTAILTLYHILGGFAGAFTPSPHCT